MNFSQKILFVDNEKSLLAGLRFNLARTFEVQVSSLVEEAKVFMEQGPFFFTVFLAFDMKSSEV